MNSYPSFEFSRKPPEQNGVHPISSCPTLIFFYEKKEKNLRLMTYPRGAVIKGNGVWGRHVEESGGLE